LDIRFQYALYTVRQDHEQLLMQPRSAPAPHLLIRAAIRLAPDEIERIGNFARLNPSQAYRRMTLMTLDADVVAASPSSWRAIPGIRSPTLLC
jgi:hypothetical protein